MYIQYINDYPAIFEGSCVLHHALRSNMNFKKIQYEELDSIGESEIRNNLFVGSVEFMEKVFSRIGIKNSLPKISERKYTKMTLEEAFRLSSKKYIFIKPVKTKQFTGLVLDGFRYASLEKLPLDTMVYAFKPFDKEIVSEFRLYIHNHKIADMKNYSGDFSAMPDLKICQSLVSANKIDFPVAYSMDVAVMEDGTTEIVEYNDFVALGNYGVPNELYYRMLKDRYFEIVKNE